MKKIRLVKADPTNLGSTIPDYVQRDVNTIRTLFMDQGYCITFEQAEAMWREYSDGFAAGWLMLPEDETEIMKCIANLWSEEEELETPEEAALKEIINLYKTYGDPNTPFEKAYQIAEKALTRYS